MCNLAFEHRVYQANLGLFSGYQVAALLVEVALLGRLAVPARRLRGYFGSNGDRHRCSAERARA